MAVTTFTVNGVILDGSTPVGGVRVAAITVPSKQYTTDGGNTVLLDGAVVTTNKDGQFTLVLKTRPSPALYYRIYSEGGFNFPPKTFLAPTSSTTLTFSSIPTANPPGSVSNPSADSTLSIGQVNDLINQRKITVNGIVTKTANYTLVVTDNIVVSNGASLTMTLPSAVTAGATGRRYTVKNVNASAATLASTAGMIDGTATRSVAQNASVTVVSDGTNWLVV